VTKQSEKKDRTSSLSHRPRRFTADAKTWAIVLAIAIGAAASISDARADQAQAKGLFKAMSDYLATQKAISFDYDTNLEIVSTQGEKIGLVSSGTSTLNRPDKIHLTRRGGFTNVEMVFDGKTLTLLGKNTNLYAQIEAPGTIDQLVDVLRDKYHRPVPGADLLMSDPYKELMPLVTEVKDLGSGVIHGVECDHLAFRAKEVDLDRARGAALSLPLCHHEQECYGVAAIHSRYHRMESGARSRTRWFQIGDSRGRQEIDGGPSPRSQ
jgi:hypothetical protein